MGNLGNGDQFNEEEFEIVYGSFDEDGSGKVERKEMVGFIQQILNGGLEGDEGMGSNPDYGAEGNEEEYDVEGSAEEDDIFKNNHDLIGVEGILKAQKNEIEKKKLELRMENERYLR